jgi:DNA-binding transcriptional LysR family regulator
VFLNEAQAVLQRADDAVRAARAVATGKLGKLHVGYAPSLTVEILPLALRKFQEQMPGVRVVLHDLSTQEMLDGLRHACLDLGLLVHPPKPALRGLRFEELRRYPLCVAMAASHPLARRRRVTVPAVAEERLIAYSRTGYPEYHDDLVALIAKPQIAEEHDSATSLIAAIEAGRGVAIVPQCLACLAGPRLKLRPLTPPAPTFVVGAVRRDGTVSPAVAAFLNAARRKVL